MEIPPRLPLPRWLDRDRGADPAARRIMQRLGDHRRYERHIDRLHQRHMHDGGLHTINESGVSLGSVVLQRGKVAGLLAREVAQGEHRIKPAQLRTVRTDGKERIVFQYGLFDLIVHGVVAEVVGEAAAPRLSAQLFSYRRGVSWLDGVAAFGRYARAHHHSHLDPRHRGLYVLRRDVASYTDSIPVDDRSVIWRHIADALGVEASVLHDRTGPAVVVEDVVRARVAEDDGSERTLQVGVATGQPIASVAFNLYLSDLDHELASIPDAFYARYSDDLLFAHPDAAVTRRAAARIAQAVADLRLELKASKSIDLYLTGSGRASVEWPDTRGARAVTFLGMDVALDGTVSLGGSKLKRLLREARHRTRNAARATRTQGDADRGRAVVAAVNDLLNAHDAALQGAPAALLAAAVTDRGQLDWLDHELAKIVAGAVSGEIGSRSFRSVPYRTMRSDWGLRSVRRARDHGQGTSLARRPHRRV